MNNIKLIKVFPIKIENVMFKINERLNVKRK